MAKDEKKWAAEKKLIPVMIKKYCHGIHGTRGDGICAACEKLTGYALFRLEQCPYKKNKPFCSFCQIHCYKPGFRQQIKAVMRYSGPRLLFRHPVFIADHAVKMWKYKKAKEEKHDG